MTSDPEAFLQSRSARRHHESVLGAQALLVERTATHSVDAIVSASGVGTTLETVKLATAPALAERM